MVGRTLMSLNTHIDLMRGHHIELVWRTKTASGSRDETEIIPFSKPEEETELVAKYSPQLFSR